jgi:ABC-type molybdenum transport system ATPase subunit/photorepair protein PhrA
MTLQQVTIKTNNRKLLKPLIASAIENEKKIVLLGLQRTQTRLAEFEQKHGLTSDEFERRLNASELAETVEFSEWRMEIGMLKLLERQYQALQDARLD